MNDRCTGFGMYDEDGEQHRSGLLFEFTSHENARRAHKALELVMEEAFSV